MSNDEPTTSKRAHEPNGDSDSDDGGWIGPLPTEAAPAKKQKSTFFLPIFINSAHFHLEQFICFGSSPI